MNLDNQLIRVGDKVLNLGQMVRAERHKDGSTLTLYFGVTDSRGRQESHAFYGTECAQLWRHLKRCSTEFPRLADEESASPTLLSRFG